MKSCGTCCRHYVLTFAFIAAFAFLCWYLWYYALQGDDVRAFHQMFMKMTVLGWTGRNWPSVILGLIEFAIRGAIIGGIFSIFEQSHRCQSCQINVIVE